MSGQPTGKQDETRERNLHFAGSAGPPGNGGVAPGAYVDTTGEGVPEGIPEEIKLSGGAPFAPLGTGTTGVGCDEFEPVIPVPDTEAEPADNDEVPVAPALEAAEFVVGGAAGAVDA
jgi:hypothetical protein